MTALFDEFRDHHRQGSRRMRAHPRDGQADEFGYDATSSAGQELRQTLGLFRRNAFKILAFAGVAVFLAMAYIWITPPLYSATAELFIDPRQKNTLADEISPTGLGSSAVGGDTLLLDSQIEVIGSQGVIERLINEQRILEDPEFVGKPSSTLLLPLKNFIKTIIFGFHDASWVSTSPKDQALKKLRRNMTIERQRNTYVIGVTMLSENAEKAALLANRIAELYIDNVNASASTETREAAKSLDLRLDLLRSAAKEAAEKVEAFKTEKGLIGAQEILLVEQQLRDLNDQLSVVRVEAQTALAVLNQVKAASAVNVAIPIGEIAESPVMSQLQTKMAELESEEAELSSTLLPQHPRFLQFRQRKQALQASLRNEYKRIISRLQVNYNSAQEKAASLAMGVDGLKSQMANSNAESIVLRELQREAEASNKVYEAFLNRSKETWEQVDIPNSTARIISEAYAVSRPAYPPALILLAASFALGTLLGFMVVWLDHIMRQEPRQRRKTDRRADSEGSYYEPSGQPYS